MTPAFPVLFSVTDENDIGVLRDKSAKLLNEIRGVSQYPNSYTKLVCFHCFVIDSNSF
jgi:hypothetical protein